MPPISLFFHKTLTIIFLLIITGTELFAQKINDTLLFIPFGNSKITSPIIKKPIEKIESGMYHYSILYKDGTIELYGDDRLVALDKFIINDEINNFDIGNISSVIVYKKDSTINQFFLTPTINSYYPSTIKSIKRINCGPNISTAINKVNIMYTWGPGNKVKDLKIPIKTYGVRESSVGLNYIAFINIKDKVFVWGDTDKQQDKIPLIAGRPEQVQSGDNHIMVLDNLGKIYVWGDSTKGQLNIPTFKNKIISIQAKNNRCMAITADSMLYIWGDGVKYQQKLSELGKVDVVSLGYDFLVLKISNPKLVNDKDQQFWKKNVQLVNDYHPTNDSISQSVDVSNFINVAIKEDFNPNKLNNLNIIHSNDSINDIHSNTQIEFEGIGNDLTIISSNNKVTRVNSNQRVIIKGNNKKGVLYLQNNSGTIIEDNSTYIIDLNSMSDNKNLDIYYTDESNNFRLKDIYIPINEMSPSGIEIIEVYENGLILNGRNFGGVDDYNALFEEVYMYDKPFEMAQFYFYFKMNDKALDVLNKGVDHELSFYSRECISALFDIYYYGLFNQTIDLDKAKYYHNLYLTYLNSR